MRPLGFNFNFAPTYRVPAWLLQAAFPLPGLEHPKPERREEISVFLCTDPQFNPGGDLVTPLSQYPGALGL